MLRDTSSLGEDLDSALGIEKQVHHHPSSYLWFPARLESPASLQLCFSHACRTPRSFLPSYVNDSFFSVSSGNSYPPTKPPHLGDFHRLLLISCFSFGFPWTIALLCHAQLCWQWPNAYMSTCSKYYSFNSPFKIFSSISNLPFQSGIINSLTSRCIPLQIFSIVVNVYLVHQNKTLEITLDSFISFICLIQFINTISTTYVLSGILNSSPSQQPVESLHFK